MSSTSGTIKSFFLTKRSNSVVVKESPLSSRDTEIVRTSSALLDSDEEEILEEGCLVGPLPSDIQERGSQIRHGLSDQYRESVKSELANTIGKHFHHLKSAITEARHCSSSDYTSLADLLNQTASKIAHLKTAHQLMRRAATTSGETTHSLLFGVSNDPEALYDAVIRNHARVFTFVNPDNRKALFLQRSLRTLLTLNPHASGVAARLQYHTEYSSYFTLSGRTVTTKMPIELLLGELSSSSNSLTRNGRFFPPVSSRIPFSSDTQCIAWLSSLLRKRMVDGHIPPTPANVASSYEQGKATGSHKWYDDAHALVLAACKGNADEMMLFMGLLAACSPNSTVQQNVANSLLNFRAVSQHCRPRFGTYPNEMLVNYLAAALGSPSGAKVSAFLSNLVSPSTSAAVTIDTHMQQLLLGASRQALSAWEYAILEDYVRTLARAVGDAPHRVQAALWCVCTNSAAVSIKAELQMKAVDILIPLIPSADLIEPELRIQLEARLHDPQFRNDVVGLLREVFLNLGYLNVLSDARSDCWCHVRLSVFIPLRSLRRSTAAPEESSTVVAEQNYPSCRDCSLIREIGWLHLIDDALLDDQDWWSRDKRLLNAWLGLRDSVSLSELKLPTAEAEDQYFHTHSYFTDDHVACISRIAPAQGYIAGLQAMML